MYVRRLIWDDWNVPHIARHDVVPDEVEEICHGRHAVREGYAGRVVLIGQTNSGRLLSVILDPDTGEEDVYYPVTSRSADRKERRIYAQFSQEPEQSG
jgi:uncharacterized DUF497 family protein